MFDYVYSAGDHPPSMTSVFLVQKMMGQKSNVSLYHSLFPFHNEILVESSTTTQTTSIIRTTLYIIAGNE